MSEIKSSHTEQHPKDDPAIQRLLKRMPESVANSFSTEHLFALREAIGVRGGRIHGIDFRPTLKLPFLPWSIYLVFLMGSNRRTLTDKEQYLAVLALLLVFSLFTICLLGFVLLILYLLKSALGIDVFAGHSLGIWDWFKEL